MDRSAEDGHQPRSLEGKWFIGIEAEAVSGNPPQRRITRPHRYEVVYCFHWLFLRLFGDGLGAVITASSFREEQHLRSLTSKREKRPELQKI